MCGQEFNISSTSPPSTAQFIPPFQWATHVTTASPGDSDLVTKARFSHFPGVGRLTAGFALTRFHGSQHATVRHSSGRRHLLAAKEKHITCLVGYLLSSAFHRLSGEFSAARANKLSAPYMKTPKSPTIFFSLWYHGWLSSQEGQMPTTSSELSPKLLLVHLLQASSQE